MSTINASSIYAEYVNVNTNIIVGNSVSNLSVSSNTVLNYLSYSEDFSNSTYWLTSNATITSNSITGPSNSTYGVFGTLNGTKLGEVAVNDAHGITQFIQPLSDTGNFSFSVYAKPAERTYMYLYLGSTAAGTIVAVYNLTTGTVYSTSFGGGTYITNAAASVGPPAANGWYKYILSGNFTQALPSTYAYGSIGIYDYLQGVTYLGTAGYGIYISSAQIAKVTTNDYYTYTSNNGGQTYLSVSSGSDSNTVVISKNTISIGNSSANTRLVVNSIGAGILTTNNLTINGTSYTSLPAYGNVLTYNVFTTTGWNQWTKPANTGPNDLVTIMAWGGGGGAGSNSFVTGGGGGACVVVNLLASQLNATCNVFVGSGGTGTTLAVNASDGQNTVFWTNSSFSITAYGGAGSNSSGAAGGGGGWFSMVTNSGFGGSPIGGNSSVIVSTFGGGFGATTSATAGGGSVYGGGGGGKGNAGGPSIYGGGGGGTNNAINSTLGGAGGNSTVGAIAPGGGGGGFASNLNGARGEVRIWVTKVG